MCWALLWHGRTWWVTNLRQSPENGLGVFTAIGFSGSRDRPWGVLLLVVFLIWGEEFLFHIDTYRALHPVSIWDGLEPVCLLVLIEGVYRALPQWRVPWLQVLLLIWVLAYVPRVVLEMFAMDQGVWDGFRALDLQWTFVIPCQSPPEILRVQPAVRPTDSLKVNILWAIGTPCDQIYIYLSVPIRASWEDTVLGWLEHLDDWFYLGVILVFWLGLLVVGHSWGTCVWRHLHELSFDPSIIEIFRGDNVQYDEVWYQLCQEQIDWHYNYPCHPLSILVLSLESCDQDASSEHDLNNHLQQVEPSLDWE